MEPEWIVMRVAYFIFSVTLAFMAWAYTIQAESMEESLIKGSSMTRGYPENMLETHSPCSFNPLCTCSKPGPLEYGIVACRGVPFGNIPLTLNKSRAFLLSMEGNNLRVLEGMRLVGSGLWRLEIKQNNLISVADDAFVGLSFLTELDLEHNILPAIPTDALRRLANTAKLKSLNLNYNKLTDIYRNDLEGLPSSITTLELAGNMITFIEKNTFTSLPRLERIDLSGNSIRFIHSEAFSSSLRHLSLANNLLDKIPSDSLSQLDLKTLDLQKNLLTSVFTERRMSVGLLRLEYNRISNIPANAFRNFRKVSAVKLSFNPLETLGADAFKESRIEQLELSNCFIREVHSKAFRGLENTLDCLDLSYNNLTKLTPDLFKGFSRLRHINIDGNSIIVTVDDQGQFTQHLPKLYWLSMSGKRMGAFSMEDIGLMRNLRGLNISKVGSSSLRAQTFDGFGKTLEDIKISHGKLETIEAGAFRPLSSLKSIDLSENAITNFDSSAFDGIEHSLRQLTMKNALRMETVPANAIRKLSAIRYLDISNNGFITIPENTFSSSQLVHLNLRFNKIDALPKRLFDLSKVPKLQRILLGFNNLREISTSSFTGLKDLEIIEINDNMIETINRRAFEDLTNLKILILSGNRLSTLKDETFQNLPKIQLCDLRKNKLESFNFNAFEHLGTLNTFRIDLSYNKIQGLTSVNVSTVIGHLHQTPGLPVFSSSSIEYLDLSHNNISTISPYFFVPFGSTLIEVILSDNRLRKLTAEHLTGMKFIQHLNLGNNLIDNVDYNLFRHFKQIQVINLDNNRLKDIPLDLFEKCSNLRVLSAKNNQIRGVTDYVFKDTKLETLILANNRLPRFPKSTLARVAETLVECNLSGNDISSLNTPNQIENLQKLRFMNLSNNRMITIADPMFYRLHSLIYLDLSGNPLGGISPRLFEEIDDTLLHLHLANMSLRVIPEFKTFSKLLTLNISYNHLAYLPTNFGVNVSTLRTFDISGNDISTSPNTIWHTIPRLSQLFMKRNPIRSLSNDSFLQLERLVDLDISDLPLESVHDGILSPLRNLQTLIFGPLPPSNINPGYLIQSAASLQSVFLKMQSPELTTELRSYQIPPKVSSLTLSGEALISIASGSFNKLVGRQLQLNIENTGLTGLNSDVFHNLGNTSQLRLGIKGNNFALKTIANPSYQYSRETFAIYLEDLELENGMAISCTCDVGWIEFWLRQWMEETCPVASIALKDKFSQCQDMLQMIRNVQCENKPETNLMQAFVSDLECGWQNSVLPTWSKMENTSIFFATITILTLKRLPSWLLAY